MEIRERWNVQVKSLQSIDIPELIRVSNFFEAIEGLVEPKWLMKTMTGEGSKMTVAGGGC